MGALLLDAEVKTCGTCRQVKPTDAFYRDSSRPGGTQRSCKECQRQRSRDRHVEFRDLHLAQMRAYDERYREQARKRDRLRYEADPEKRKAARRDWGLRNRDRVNELLSQRRARLAQVSVHEVTDRDWQRLVRRYRGLCAYCQKEPWRHRDHVIPISRGGQHSIGNLLPACERCNCSKKDKTLTEWIKSRSI